MPALHDDELEVDVQLVGNLVGRDLPEYAGLRIQPLSSSGSTNSLFRLGDKLLVRLPRQPGSSATIQKEARWLPVIAPSLTAAAPQVVALGRPGFGYPESWAVTTWLDGETPTVPRVTDGGSSYRLARGLAELVTELRDLEVPLAANNDPALTSYRGGTLADVDRDFCESVEACRPIGDLGLDLDRALKIWGDALAAERATDPLTTWYHGDLLAENLLTRDGELTAVLDFGGLAVGDPAVDLSVAWEVLDPRGRETFKAAVSVDDAAWTKGMGWALLIAMITFPYYWDTMPARCADRRAMAAAVLAEA